MNGAKWASAIAAAANASTPLVSPTSRRSSQVFHQSALLREPVWPVFTVPIPEGPYERLHGEYERCDDWSWHLDERKWLRWPGIILRGFINLTFRTIPRLIWFRFLAVILENLRRLLSTNLYHTAGFVVFVPLGLLASTLHWRPELWAALNALALGSAAFLAAVLAEEFVHFCPLGLGLVAELLFSNFPWLLIGIWALLRGQFHIIQNIIPGSILCRNTLALGCGILIRSTSSRQQTLNGFMVSTAALLRFLGFLPLVLCSLLGEVFDSNHSSGPGDPVLFFSRGTAIVFIFCFFTYWYFYSVIHDDLFALVEREYQNEWSRLPSHNLHQRLIALLALVVCTASATLCSFHLVQSMTLIPSGGPHELNRTFIGIVLLPVLVNHSEIVTIFQTSIQDGLEGVLVTAENTTICTILFTVPLLVLLGWGTGRPLSLELPLLPLIVFGVGTWVSGVMLQDGRSNYLKGAIFIGL